MNGKLRRIEYQWSRAQRGNGIPDEMWLIYTEVRNFRKDGKLSSMTVYDGPRRSQNKASYSRYHYKHGLLSKTVTKSSWGNRWATTYRYDSGSRLVQEWSIRVRNSQLGGTKGFEFARSYSWSGNTMIRQLDSSRGGRRTVFSFQYDNKGRLVSKRLQSMSAASQYSPPRIDSFVYDGAGRLLSEMTINYSSVEVTKYKYDAAGRIISKRSRRGDVNNADTSKIIRITRCYEYDAPGNLIRRTDTLWNGLSTVTGASFFSTLYSYDSMRNKVSEVHSDEQGMKDAKRWIIDYYPSRKITEF